MSRPRTSWRRVRALKRVPVTKLFTRIRIAITATTLLAFTGVVTVAAWAAGPVDGPTGQRAATRELAKFKYRQNDDPLIVRWFQDLMDMIDRFFNRAQNVAPGGGWGLLIIVVLLLAGIGLLIWRFGLPSREVRSGGEPELRLGSGTARTHQARADAYAAEGRFAEAVRERLRGVVRSLEERELMDPRPGRTVTEIVAVVRRKLPDAAEPLRRGGGIFSDIWYGGRAATREDDDALRTVAETVASTKPSATSGEPVGAGWTMPGSDGPAT